MEEVCNTERIPFPGKSARFHLESGDWKIDQTSTSAKVRELEFLSDTEGSFFREVGIYGDREGHLKLMVIIDRTYTDIAWNYFEQVGVRRAFLGIVCTDEHQEMKRLFSIVIENNTFPKKEIELVRKLVDAGEWKSVTPLDPDEKLPPIIDRKTIEIHLVG